MRAKKSSWIPVSIAFTILSIACGLFVGRCVKFLTPEEIADRELTAKSINWAMGPPMGRADGNIAR